MNAIAMIIQVRHARLGHNLGGIVGVAMMLSKSYLSRALRDTRLELRVRVPSPRPPRYPLTSGTCFGVTKLLQTSLYSDWNQTFMYCTVGCSQLMQRVIYIRHDNHTPKRARQTPCNILKECMPEIPRRNVVSKKLRTRKDNDDVAYTSPS